MERNVLAINQRSDVMKNYELSVLIHPDLEMDIEPATNKIKELIERNGGTITKVTNDGKKRLAYPIKKQDFAIYYFYELSLPPEAPAKIQNVLNITDEVLRFLLVTVDERKLKYEAQKAAWEARREQEATAEKEEEK